MGRVGLLRLENGGLSELQVLLGEECWKSGEMQWDSEQEGVREVLQELH